MIKVGIMGSTGYVGQELVRLLINHPNVEIHNLASHSYQGKPYDEIYPNYAHICTEICTEDDIQQLDCDVLFISLPHGHASRIVTDELLSRMKVIDMGADFRITHPSYEKWYQVPHGSPELIQEATYGLPEWNRDRIQNARLVANPGCYVTCSLLTLLPLVKEGVIDASHIIIDAKSGVTGAGRSLNLATHYTECNETIKAYSLTTHRHTPEIEEYLHHFTGTETQIMFTPHLVPMNRGILSTIYAKPKYTITELELEAIYFKYYQNEPFIRYRSNIAPETRFVKGSNYCDIHARVDTRSQTLLLVSAMDNMMKGAASQAIQNMNLMLGFEEKTGIAMAPFFPA